MVDNDGVSGSTTHSKENKKETNDIKKKPSRPFFAIENDTAIPTVVVNPFLNNLTQSQHIIPATPVISSNSNSNSFINKSNLHDPDLIQHGIDSNDKKQMKAASVVVSGSSSSGNENSSNELQINKTQTRIDKQSMEYVLKSGLAGGIAGVFAKTLIAPLDRIKILFQTGNPHFLQYRGSMNGLLKAMHHISLVDGFRGFYQGHSATLVRVFPYAGIKFITYEQFRNFFIPTPEYEQHWRRLVSGSCAGLSSVFVTYPLDLVRVKLAYITHRKDAKLFPLIKDTYYNNGLKPGIHNFYKGFMPTMYGMVPYAGVAFFAHDFCHDIFKSPLLKHVALEYESDRDGKVLLKTWAELVSGGLAGMLSQTAAYPFEIIRRRLQVTKIMKLNCSSMAKLIYKEQGFRGFYVGLSIGYIKVMPMVACSFYVYEQMKWLLDI
ncbi:mitochondrial carrier [Hanseniaspora valbyensis NRRL Y-1626]|uniref:Mitochondrial carrier n=1 Tax=Hanseniaspora valbyensis NRRL Y-1626 TaxID=766949 RepID=A0A1B7TGB7_9ASCO|nr:mitochondrial carrier [Hanseniaspora valbyensis NRRL Y-1626]